MANYDFKNEVEITGKVCAKSIKENPTTTGKIALDFGLNIQVGTQQLNEQGILEQGQSKSGFLSCAVFVTPEKAAAVKDVVKEGAVITAKGRIVPEQWQAKDGTQRHDFKIVVNDVKPYVKAAEGEQSNARNNVLISGMVANEPQFLGKNQSVASFNIAVNEGERGKDQKTHFFHVVKPFKEEDRAKYESTIKKGQALTVQARFEPNTFTNRASKQVVSIDLHAFSVEHAAEKATDGSAAQPKEQEPFNKAKEIEKQPALTQALRDKGVDPMSLTDKQVMKMYWYHSPLEVNTPNGRFSFTQTRNEDKSYSVQAQQVQQQKKEAQTEAER